VDSSSSASDTRKIAIITILRTVPDGVNIKHLKIILNTSLELPFGDAQGKCHKI
jgi:hypothetical protein